MAKQLGLDGVEAEIEPAGKVAQSHVRMEAKRRALDEIAARQRAADEKRQREAERSEQAAVASQAAVIQ